VKVYLCRDNDGDYSVWDASGKSPERYKGIWCDDDESAVCLARNSNECDERFERNLEGVQTGGIREIDLEKR